MKIELGVIDQPYADTSTGTGDVAEFLEKKYGIIERFVDKHGEDIQTALEESFVNAFEDTVRGFPGRPAYASGLQKIQIMMKRWLSTQEIEGSGIPGVPTKAALMGKSSRFKSGLNQVSMKKFNKGIRQGARRPSFIDTGLYEASMKAWIEGSS